MLTDSEEAPSVTSQSDVSSFPSIRAGVSAEASASLESHSSFLHAHSSKFPPKDNDGASLCIAVIGATGELARKKIFPALFALYYSGFLPEVRQLLSCCSAIYLEIAIMLLF